MPEGGDPPGVRQFSSSQADAAVYAANAVSSAHHAGVLNPFASLADATDGNCQVVPEIGSSEALGRHLAAATEELHAVLLHTAEATGQILDGCEALDAAVQGCSCRATVANATARIYEACSFQDITGQRIEKVVQALRTIDGIVHGALGGFSAPGRHPRAALLNGPQRHGVAMQQREVDALLDGFE